MWNKKSELVDKYGSRFSSIPHLFLATVFDQIRNILSSE